MLWDRGHRSNDVIDHRGRRAMGGGGGGGGGMIFGLLFSLVRSKFGWFGVIVLVVGYFLLTSMGGLGGLTGSQGGGVGLGAVQDPSAPVANDEQASFVGFVLDDVQGTWDKLSPIDGTPYRRAKLVLFTGAVDTACGTGESATGPFYCPGDQRVYIDLGFYRALKDRLGAPGDFAQAYVIAHEVGHHLQKLMGTSDRVQRAGRAEGAEGASVRLELQADCYAGVWAHSSRQRKLLEAGDIEEALTAAAAIGDDTLQRHATGRVRPETFSHGTSEQRMRWFNRGLESGDPATCDTFAARQL
jgi:predicted metalloprotease